MRAAVDHLFRDGRLLMWGVAATGVLVETLLDRGGQSHLEGDLAEAEAAIERLTATPTDDSFRVRDIWLLRLEALLARARGDHESNRELVRRYHAMAKSVGYEAHITWANAMARVKG
jgi:hypothetical protein